jgi:hypothetical protein
MRSSSVRVGSKSNNCLCIRKEKEFWTDTHTEGEGHLEMEAETEVVQLQAKECKHFWPPENHEGVRKDSLETLGQNGSAGNLISDFHFQN